MKRYTMISGLCALFLLMLCFPKACFQGASAGLLLWFRTVLPTLFPFLVISSLLVRTRAIEGISRILSPVICPLFGVSKASSFAVLGGFLCGYPMGAKITSDLLEEGYISQREGNYLLSFCNNTSPMFVISYIVLQNLRRPELGMVSLGIMLASPVLLSFLFRRIWLFGKDSAKTRSQGRLPVPPLSFPSALDLCIMNACETITKIGGYIMVFSIILELCRLLPVHGFFWEMICLPSLEITGGVASVCKAALPFSVRYILVMALASFGGFCAVFQTQCMVQTHEISMAAYLLEKLGTAMVSSLLAFLYTVLF